MKLRLKYAERFVGVFAIIAALIFVFAITFILINKKFFQTKIVYSTKFADANGLGSSTPVFLKGLKIGTITEFHLTRDNYIIAKMEIYDEYREKIVLNSAVWKGMNPVTNTGTLEFLPGVGENLILAEGSLIPAIDVPEGRRLLNEKKVVKAGDPLSSMVSNLEEFTSVLTSDTIRNTGPLFRMINNMLAASEDLKKISAKTDVLLAALMSDHNPQDGTVFRIMNNVADLTDEFKITEKMLKKTLVRADSMLIAYQKPDSLAIKMIDPTGEYLINPIRQTIAGVNTMMPKLDYFVNYMNAKSSDLSVIIEDLKVTLRQAQMMLDTFNQLTGGATGRPSVSNNSLYQRPKEKE